MHVISIIQITFYPNRYVIMYSVFLNICKPHMFCETFETFLDRYKEKCIIFRTYICHFRVKKNTVTLLHFQNIHVSYTQMQGMKIITTGLMTRGYTRTGNVTNRLRNFKDVYSYLPIVKILRLKSGDRGIASYRENYIIILSLQASHYLGRASSRIRGKLTYYATLFRRVGIVLCRVFFSCINIIWGC